MATRPTPPAQLLQLDPPKLMHAGTLVHWRCWRDAGGMDWERYDARLLAMRPELLCDALRLYASHLDGELQIASDTGDTVGMGYYAERLTVVNDWRAELAAESEQA